MNYSKQRELIKSILRSTTSHPTAEWIYEKARREMPNISYGTVYRNLNQLVESGEIIRIQGAFEKDKYDGNAKPHAHFVCNDCKKVFDFEIDAELEESIKLCAPKKSDRYELSYLGICEDCEKIRQQKNQNK